MKKEFLAEIKNLDLFLPGTKERPLVLKSINLKIERGYHYFITGKNGSGKSTLLRLLAGSLVPCKGTVTWTVNGEEHSSRIMAKKISLLISPAVQDNLQKFALNVTGHDYLKSVYHNYHSQPVENIVEDEIGALAEKLDAARLLAVLLPEMSQGQLRLLMLAGAILAKPQLLLLDEALDGLDEARKNEILAMLENMTPETTIVCATHRTPALMKLPGKYFQMAEGQIFPGSPESANPKKYDDKAFADAEPGSAICELKNTDVFINRKKVLFQIDWTIRENENWLVTGENGSGKSTLLRLLAGREFAACGGVLNWSFNGKAAHAAEAIKNVALVSDFSQLNYDYPVTALELVLSGIDLSVGLYREFSSEEKERALNLINSFFLEEKISGFAQKSIRRLSTGQLRRLFLARAMISRPRLLLLDEACNGLDEPARRQFLELVDKLACGLFFSFPVAIVYTSHYEEDRPACINRFARMKNGSLILKKAYE